MAKIIFFDTETTGNTEKDFLCQIAYKSGEEKFSGLYKPSVKIPPEASAVHHITNKMVADKHTFFESGDMPKIKELFEDKDSIVVAHNAPFDLMMIEKENIKPGKFICTLRVARHLDKEEKFGNHRLQYLRYFLEIEIEADAHDALGDVLVLEKLFEYLKNKIMQEEKITEGKAVEKMVEISSNPSILRKMTFGKHIGKRIDEVLKTDRRYLEWLLGEKQKGGQNEEDWIYTLKHYLGK